MNSHRIAVVERRPSANTGGPIKDPPKWKRRMSFTSTCTSTEEIECHQDVEAPQDEPISQYRIQSKIHTKHRSMWCRIKAYFGCWGPHRFDAFTYDSLATNSQGIPCYNCDPNVAIVSFLSWSFRTSLSLLIATLTTVFFVLVILFTLFFMILGSWAPTCIEPEYNLFGTPFADAYALSWTTFTTVGYGHTYPSTSVENSNQKECILIQIVCSLESFIGVIWASCCGAIIFSKVIRIQSLAPVVFSDPITVRFGEGVLDDYDNIPQGKIPCPILSFRLANVHNDRPGGEVVNATINVLAIFSDKESHQNNFVKSSGKRFSWQSTEYLSEEAPKQTMTRSNSISMNIVGDSNSKYDFHRAFAKLVVDTEENPFFKRTWSVHHILDQNSPLLSQNVRRQIELNEGYWPPNLMDAKAVRESIEFSQIFVSLSGTSIISADNVYAQHMYDYVDMNVGYQFVSIIRRCNNEVLVDIEMLNDVVEQIGGDGEILDEQNSSQIVINMGN